MDKEKEQDQIEPIELISGLLGELTMRVSALEHVLITKGLVTEKELAESLAACILKLQAIFDRAANSEPDSISTE